MRLPDEEYDDDRSCSDHFLFGMWASVAVLCILLGCFVFFIFR